MLIEDFYRRAATDEAYRTVLLQTDWFASNVAYDPMSGGALPELLTDFLARIAEYKPSLPYKDRVAVILDGCGEPLCRLLGNLNEEPRRSHTEMPYWKARELDASSFIALSRRSGSTIREKLAEKPNIQAVRHYLSVDTTENRLLKALVLRLCDLLELRHRLAGKTDYEALRDRMYRWLGTDEAQEIGRWENRAPNNTLLGHRDYRRIWRAWAALQAMEEDLEEDLRETKTRQAVIDEWTDLAKTYAGGQRVFAEIPILPDIETFRIKVLTPKGWQEGVRPESFDKPRRPFKPSEFSRNSLVCLDPGYFRPRYAVGDEEGEVSELFIEQFGSEFADKGEVSSFTLKRSDCVSLQDGVRTITYPDLIYADAAGNAADRDQAAHGFARSLAEIFHTPEVVWLTPDFRDDFSLELVRKSFNARFARAVPIPRSVAAVFQHVPYDSILKDDFCVAVYEPYRGKLYKTLLVAKYSSKLKQAIPETRGYRWQKQVTVESERSLPPMETDCGFWVLRSGRLSRIYNDYGTVCKAGGDLLLREWNVDLAIVLRSSPVSGGLALQRLQATAPDEPLWQNAIPELMIKVVRGEALSNVYLVNSETKVEPVPGKPVDLPIKEHFTLPAGKKYYRFRLYKGYKGEAIGYQMKLESKFFPLEKDVQCKLNMTYTYGADNPFRLEFRPIWKKSLPPVVAQWQLLEEIDDAPGPAYPETEDWEALKEMISPKNKKKKSIQKWLQTSLKTFCDALSAERKIGYPKRTEWMLNEKGRRYLFVEDGDGWGDVYVDYNSSSDSVKSSFTFDSGRAYFYAPVTVESGREAGWWLSRNEEEYEAARRNSLVNYARKALMFPFCRLWQDGFSCSRSGNAEAERYAEKLQPYFRKLVEYVEEHDAERALCERICLLLCIAYRDIEDKELRERVLDEMSRFGVGADPFGYLLGTLDRLELIATLDYEFRRFGMDSVYAIAKASWRNPEFIHCLSADQLVRVGDALLSELKRSQALFENHPTGKQYQYSRKQFSVLLELLFALLRTRESEDEAIRSLFQPGRPIVKEFLTLVEELIEFVLKSDADLYFRVEVTVNKAKDDPTPDFLYALRSYLEGNDDSLCIRVKGITEDG